MLVGGIAEAGASTFRREGRCAGARGLLLLVGAWWFRACAIVSSSCGNGGMRLIGI